MSDATRSEDLAILARLNQDYLHADQTNDVERFKELLADDFVMQLEGVTRHYDEYLDFIAEPRLFRDLAARNVNIRILGDVALIHARSTLTTLDDGVAKEALYTDIYQKRDGRWVCVAACVGPLETA